MKKTLSYLGLAVLILASCAKETNEPVQSPVDEGFSIKAYVVDGDVTKTTYAGETTFSWDGEEIISMQLIKKSDSTRDRWLFYNNSDAGTTANYKSSGSLSSDTWGLGEYAFYPAKANSNCPDGTWNIGNYQAVNSGTAEVRANSVVVSDYVKASVSSPMQYIPLIGVKDGDGNFGFHTATGILKVTVSNIDARLAKVQLYSEGQKLNGTYTLTGSGTGAYIAMTTTSTASEQVFNAEYTDWTSQTSLPFYFPVPVGTLNSGFKVRLLDSNSNVLKQVSAPSNVLIERNKISEITTAIPLPDEDFSATITPGGTSTAITAKIDITKDATSVKAVVASSVSAGESLIDAGGASVVSFANGETKSLPMTNITSSGTAYIVAKTYSGETAKLTTSEAVYVLNTTDASSLLSQYARDLAYGSSSVAGFDLYGSNTITLAASNDVTKGNLMIVEFAGYSFDVSESVPNYYVKDYSSFTDGTPVYGIYGNGIIYGGFNGATFTVSNDVPYYTDATSHVHFVSPCTVSTSGQIQIGFNSTEKTSASHDLVVHNTYIGNAYNTYTGGYDIYFTNYVANKTKGIINLTTSMLDTNSKYGEGGSGDSGGMAALVDKASGTKWWHSNYNGSTVLDEYGLYVQINLTSLSKTVQNFSVKFLTRSNITHGLPTKYRVAVSKTGLDGSWLFATDEISVTASANKWYQCDVTTADEYSYIRLCITEMNHNNGNEDPVNLTSGTEGNGVYTHLDELQLWEN